jgi:myo-inositol-1(or 4)-monophosphatase
LDQLLMSAAATINRDYEQLRREAMPWVREAGRLAVEYYGAVAAERKADDSYITEADHAVQALLLESIARRHPADAVISEEIQADPQRHATLAGAKRCWIVDPIDGTRSFARGFPGFCISVAMLEAGLPAVGLIFNPLTNHMFSATAGGGAIMNDRPLRARDEVLSADSIVAIPSRRRGQLAPVVHRWLDSMVVRNLGSTALHLALLASGALDAVFADECRLWDIAAGELILREAGASLVSLNGRPYFPMDVSRYANEETPFLAGGPKILQALLNEYRSETLK